MTEHAHEHPPVRLYVQVIVALAVITAIEIAIILPDVKDWYHASAAWFVPLVAPVLIIFSLGKFMGVILFFMHLKQDRGVSGALPG